MPYKKLRIEVRNRVGYLTLDSGARFNKLSVTTIRELKRALAELENDEYVGCILLSGWPGESFAVGADIGQMRPFTPLDGLQFADLGQSLFDQMERITKPIIGAVNGIAMGGGCDLALACDMRIASDRTLIAHPGARLGIITGFCGTQKLPRLVGKNRAREIFVTCDSYNAAEALQMGLVDRVVNGDRYWDEVVAVAERIASMPPSSLAWAKQLVNLAEETTLRSGCLVEQGAASLCSLAMAPDSCV
ncbi:enoyl-CoA hydratase/isomerase family protein [Trichlorobacter sp.]|jgi:enoyl-CoA hydratase|uniref:enoyl-CoA hydratase/isomerase family protein n=1 Tax=Trichlorobacter sp. TaxID=2911007 RepID=UPI002A36DAEF|nr:enoyl-CoA hydratase/isomerase family protein [Trichlorobacter sp.]MDY0384616.1 enoyl-CoA hydratase/isomerase family protein [Trichlorobacter sp.]